MKKKNSGGSLVGDPEDNEKSDTVICTEYVTKLREKNLEEKKMVFREKEPYRWKRVNGFDCIEFFKV